MNSNVKLTEGVLRKIMRNNEQIEGPIVQILGSKQLINKNIRSVLYDGIETSQHCLFINSQQMENRFKSGEFDKFSVIRLDSYLVSVSDANDIPVLFVKDLTLIMTGSKIGRKLQAINNGVNSNANQTSVESNRNIQSFGEQNNASFAGNNFNNINNITNDGNNEMRVKTRIGINPENVCPIAVITPFFNAWLIRVRITAKSEIRTYDNKRGNGKLFSFDATDDSSEIRITAFNNECDKYYNIIEKDMVYYISKGNVRTANKKYSNLKSDYEITLTNDSIIELCNETIPLPKLMFKFVSIKDITNISNGSSIDVIGIIRSVTHLDTIISKKNSKEYKKREVLLLDKSCCEVRLTIWGKEAEDFNAVNGSVLAVKNAVVGEFKGKTLGTVQNSTLEVDPDLPEAHILKGWYDREGHNLTNILPLSKPNDSNTSNPDKYLSQVNMHSIPDNTVLYFNTKAMIQSTNRPQNQLYKSCGLNGCMKKVREEGTGLYHCDKCGNISPAFQWRLMISLCCVDCSGEMWFTAFQEVAEKMIGISVNQLSQMFETDQNQYQSVISGLHFKTFDFRIGSKVEEYNNEKRVKSTCFGANPINTIERSKKLIQKIKMWSR